MGKYYLEASYVTESGKNVSGGVCALGRFDGESFICQNMGYEKFLGSMSVGM